MDVVEIVVTGPAQFVTEHVAALVEERLIACAQCTPVTSTYRWEAAVERAEEVRAHLHTTAARAREVSARIEAAHPYDVPCILVFPVGEALPSYADWVTEETNMREDRDTRK